MAGIAKNRLRRPGRPSLLVDTQMIIDTFANYAVRSNNLRLPILLKSAGDSLPTNKYRLVLLHIVTVDETPLHLDVEDYVRPSMLRFAHL